jgi:ParB family chromosome partitioning protein
LIENMAREDLNPVEEARACAALVEELGLSREEVGIRVGRSRVAVSNLLRLLDLPDEALVLIEQGVLSEGHGRALLLAGEHDARKVACSQRRPGAVVGADARAGPARATRTAQGRHRPNGRPSIPTSLQRARRSLTRSPRRSAPRSTSPSHVAAATERSSASPRPRKRSNWRSASVPQTPARIAAATGD